MAKRIVKEGVVVLREGKRVRPAVGKAFDFTAEEIKQLEKVRPQSIGKLSEVEVDENSTDVDGNGDGAGAGEGVGEGAGAAKATKTTTAKAAKTAAKNSAEGL